MKKLSFKRYIGRKICDIDEICPTICFNEGAYLTIECSWRLRKAFQIIIGCIEYKSEVTHNDVYKKLKSLLIGRKIKKIVVDCKMKLNS